MITLTKNNNHREELRSSVVNKLIELMSKDDKVVALEADLGGASGFTKIKKTNPDRFVQCGISEANMVGVAAGLSMVGYKPFMHTFGAFATRRAYDQIFLSCGYSNNDINIYGSDPGFTSGTNGGTHTTLEDIALMKSIPNAIVCDAADDVQMKWILEEFTKSRGVKYVRGNRKSVSAVYEEGSQFKMGKANKLTDGKDVLIISCGQLCYDSLVAAKNLEALGISCTVIDMFCIKPLDINAILENAVDKKLIVTFENHSIVGGLGSSVAEVIAENSINVKFKRIGTNDHFGEVGSPDYLQDKYGLTSKHLEDVIKELL